MSNTIGPGPNEPVTRNLEKLVEACEIVESELGFQLHRLTEHVRPRTDSEEEYHENMKNGYANARRWVGIMKRYHMGRLERERAGESAVQNTDTEAAE